MPKAKFNKFAAVMRNNDGNKVVLAPWKNISRLRLRRRTSSSFKHGKIKRIPLDSGIQFLFDEYGQDHVLDNYPNLGFYKFVNDQLNKIKKYFDNIVTSPVRLSILDRQQMLPTWLVDVVKNVIKNAEINDTLWYSYRKFYDEFYYKTNYIFSEHPVIKALLYTRFELSLAGTLEDDIILYVAPKPKKKAVEKDYNCEYTFSFNKNNVDRYWTTVNRMYDDSFGSNRVLRDYISSINTNTEWMTETDSSDS